MTVIEMIVAIGIATAFAACCFFGILILKNENALKNCNIIVDAIYQYNCDCALYNRPSEVSYEDMVPYEYALCRLWDWGYTRILPKEKYEIIKPYIKTAKTQSTVDFSEKAQPEGGIVE